MAIARFVAVWLLAALFVHGVNLARPFGDYCKSSANGLGGSPAFPSRKSAHGRRRSVRVGFWVPGISAIMRFVIVWLLPALFVYAMNLARLFGDYCKSGANGFGGSTFSRRGDLRTSRRCDAVCVGFQVGRELRVGRVEMRDFGCLYRSRRLVAIRLCCFVAARLYHLVLQAFWLQ
ncbi:hypothetical protein [Bifidobacterium sp. ESL0704]|uniref:hypothetical protein n=1 Tax=Bifidobacterium sp. ESL0704 TaxID=2983219 RepID=UPI0023F7D481|nr:hypothetical protein [Bifidobacterium sp. ESL0704]WEV52997.1 hypothetical protein OZX64_00345 [Bifidobacterium sp. ESL0704]